MLDRQNLLRSFAQVDEHLGCYFFRYVLPAYTVEHCLSSGQIRDLLVICEQGFDRAFAASICTQAPATLTQDRPCMFPLAQNPIGFTHVLVVPNTYHGALSGPLAHKRDQLFLCIPIYRCEFTGEESASEFKAQIGRQVHPYDWTRQPCPKITVYFDNPTTGGGTEEDGALLGYQTVLNEIDNLNGVVAGFMEITNYEGHVIEILSPAPDRFVLIRDRKDEYAMTHPELSAQLHAFCFTGAHGSV